MLTRCRSAAAGWPCVIISDQLIIRAYSGPDFFAPDSLVVKPNIALDQGQQLSMATQLAAQTGLTQAFALNCLGELGWDIEKAVAGALARCEECADGCSRRTDPQSDPARGVGVEPHHIASIPCSPTARRPRSPFGSAAVGSICHHSSDYSHRTQAVVSCTTCLARPREIQLRSDDAQLIS